VISYLPIIPLAYFGVRLSIIDFKTHRLPNQLVGRFTASQLLTLIAVIQGGVTSKRLYDALTIAGLCTLTYLILYILSRGSLGMGDVKFAFPLGLCLGWYAAQHWLMAIFASFLLAGVTAIIGLVTKRMNRKSRLAFGPYMFLGTLITCGFAVIYQ
jgi:leader peptidase (prepilin peptidase)/N-methyltransferase